MKLFIHVNSFEKSSVKLWPFCPGRDELKNVLLYLFEYFCFVQCFLHPRSAGMLKLGQRVGAFATHREAAARNPAPTHSWDDCAGARPAVLSFELVLPGIMRPLSSHQRCGPCCGTLICECNGDIDDFYIF